MSRGRPLRFLGWVLGGWVALRLGMAVPPMLQPAAEAARPGVVRAQPLRPGIAWNGEQALAPTPADLDAFWKVPAGRSAPVALWSDGKEMLLRSLAPGGDRDLSRSARPVAQEPADEGPAPDKPLSAARDAFPPSGEGGFAAPAVTAAAGAPGSPWALSAWALWRPDAGASLAQAPLLGGSQGGVRLDYRLWRAGTRSLALYGRVTRALERPFAEQAALGLALRPAEGVPMTLHAERRQRLGAGGRSGFTLFAAGGIGPRPIAPAIDLEGYVQAGVVGLPGAAGFADGRMALGYRLTPRAQAADLAVGIAVSGGAQPGAARLDIGPELRLRLPVAGGHLRLSAEWRQRIGGAARPASGPALALVADF